MTNDIDRITPRPFPKGLEKLDETWTDGEFTFGIWFHSNETGYHNGGWYCGYCTLPEPLPHGIIKSGDDYWSDNPYGEIEAHGGITCGGEVGSTMIGFDCAHCGDEDDPKTRDKEWVKKQCELMAQSYKEVLQRIIPYDRLEHCVNNHDKLVAALSDAMQNWDYFCDTAPVNPEEFKRCADILAAAKGGK